MVASHLSWSQEEEDTFEDHIEDELYVEPPPFDIHILTPEQRVQLYWLQQKKENWRTTSITLARTIRMSHIWDRAEFEGREVTTDEIKKAHDLKEVIYWVPPTQLEGICNSNLELHFENICLPYVEEIAPNLNCLVLINECLDLICETKKLDDLRVEKLTRDHIEVCFNKNYLWDELDVDKLLLDIENSLAKNNHENEDIVFYLIDGDRIDYFVKISFEQVVDFVFLPNAFNSHDHFNLKEHFIIHAISFLKLFDEKYVYYLWTVVCSFAHFVSCVCRRRTKASTQTPVSSSLPHVYTSEINPRPRVLYYPIQPIAPSKCHSNLVHI
ncbi:hypothetical protein N665_0125s0025 [Sinapis alba]|nr:hypothetical protein N665_0125s0025 [Sinapis alba]